jgi:hypothetical protein
LKNIEEQKLLAAARHIVHDYANLVSAGELVCGSLPTPLTHHTHHVEYSFLVHCRIFSNFFRNSQAKRDDVLVNHFIGDGAKFTFPEWQKWEDHMNKHLFHMSYERIGNSRQWKGHKENRPILEYFVRAWKTFLDKLPRRIQEEFERQISDKLNPGSGYVLSLAF